MQRQEKPKLDKCPQHMTESLLFYCASCDIHVCQHCLVPGHLKHDVQQRGSDQNEEGQTGDSSPSKQHLLAPMLKQEDDKIQKCVNDHVTKIKQEGQVLRGKLQKFETEVCHPYLQGIRSDIKDLENKLETLSNIKKSVNEYDDYTFLALYQTISEQLDDLIQEKPVHSFGVHKPNIPHFLPRSGSERTLGTIYVPGEDIPAQSQSRDDSNSPDDTYHEVETIAPSMPRRKPPTPATAKKAPAPPHRSSSLSEIEQLPTNTAKEKAPAPRPRRRSTPAVSLPEDNSDGANFRFTKVDKRSIAENPVMINTVEFQFMNEFGKFSDAVSVARGHFGRNDIFAVSDEQKRQITVWKRQGQTFEKDSHFKCGQPKDVALTRDGTTIIVANGMKAEMYSVRDNYCFKTVKTVEGAKSKSSKGFDIRSVITMNDDHSTFLLGDVARQVVTQHDQSGRLVKTMPIPIKPYSMVAISDKRFAVSDNEKGHVLIKDICRDPRQGAGQFRCFPVANAHGLCFSPVGLLFVGQRKSRKGAISVYSFDVGCEISKLTLDLSGHVAGLFKPGGMTLMSKYELAIADKKSVKIYQFKKSDF